MVRRLATGAVRRLGVEVREGLDKMGPSLRALSPEEWIFSEAGAENGDAHGVRTSDGCARQAV